MTAKTFTAPSWAKPITTGGKRIASYKGDGFTADLFLLEQFKAESGNTYDNYKEASAFYGQPKVKTGDVIDVYSCVITNTSGKSMAVNISSIKAKIGYDNEGAYTSLYNSGIKKKYGLDDYPNITSSSVTLPSGYSIALGGPRMHQAGKVLNVAIEVRKVPTKYDSAVYGGIHIITP